MRPRALRRRLLWVVVAGLAVGLAIGVFFVWLAAGHLLSDQASAAVRERATLEATAVDALHARLGRASERLPGEGETWLVVGGRVAEGPRVKPSLTRAVLALSHDPDRLRDGPGPMRLYAISVASKGKVWGTVVTGVALAPYERTRRLILVGSAVAALVILAAVAAATQRALARALAPVASMTAAAEIWSIEDPERRFAPGEPYDEISALACSLDRLLDRLAAALRTEKLLSAEVAHELRGPLAQMRSEAEVALRQERSSAQYREALQAILGSIAHLSGAVDGLLESAAQRQPAEQGRCLAAEVLREAAASCEALATDRAVALSVEPCDGIAVGAERAQVLRLLHPVVENACQHASSLVCLSASAPDASSVELHVDNDGHGLAASDCEQIFEPGVRGTSREGPRGNGAGLGLALARRLASALDGEIVAEPGEGGHFVVRLPAG